MMQLIYAITKKSSQFSEYYWLQFAQHYSWVKPKNDAEFMYK